MTTATVLTHYLSCNAFQMAQKEQAEEELGSSTMAIFIFREGLHSPEDVGIIIDGMEVISALPSAAYGVVLLFGLCYALNMEYPEGFKFTFEAIQKILMELGSNKMSPKMRKLHGELHTAQ